MVTARAIAAAETDLRKAEQSAIHARGMLQKATVRDGRLMSMLPSSDPRRRSFEDATRECAIAERQAHEARAKLDRLRSANGGGKPSVKQARLNLATAIEHEKRARSAVKRNAAAMEKAADEARTARAQLEHAEAGAEEAKAETTAAAMAKARSKLTAAEDVAQAAANMRAKLEQKAAELDRAAEDAGPPGAGSRGRGDQGRALGGRAARRDRQAHRAARRQAADAARAVVLRDHERGGAPRHPGHDHRAAAGHAR